MINRTLLPILRKNAIKTATLSSTLGFTFGIVTALWLLMLGSLSAPSALAQDVYHSLSGRVVMGARTGLPQAPAGQLRVMLVREDSRFRQMTLTDAQGAYFFSDLSSGKYRIEVRGEGFETIRDWVVIDGDEVLDLQLEPGADLQDVVPRLRSTDHRHLGFQVATPDGGGFRLDIWIQGKRVVAQLQEDLGQLGSIDLERNLNASQREALLTHLTKTELLTREHRGSSLRSSLHETLEVSAGGVFGVLVITGNADFSSGPGKDLIRFLYSLYDSLSGDDTSQVDR